ncbi:MAG: hypothetical protein KVP17_003468 [Porospora cf. gigantea B]|uniref:uncharacterized protein n=1 Tax=Porospora cf. gigantea B TaxID=2853592 RepID=UPI003571E913|nr:MAG: hypothetical protein KVP17_003468 [Porospora cf. gigantea B]
MPRDFSKHGRDDSLKGEGKSRKSRVKKQFSSESEEIAPRKHRSKHTRLTSDSSFPERQRDRHRRRYKDTTEDSSVEYRRKKKTKSKKIKKRHVSSSSSVGSPEREPSPLPQSAPVEEPVAEVPVPEIREGPDMREMIQMAGRKALQLRMRKLEGGIVSEFEPLNCWPDREIVSCDARAVLYRDGIVLHRGEDPPKPISNFSELEGVVPRFVNAYLSDRNWDPSPIQRIVVPALLQGRSIFAIAPTGTGKTLSYLVPCLTRALACRRTRKAAESEKRLWPEMYAFVVVPTRELAMQIFDVAATLRNFSVGETAEAAELFHVAKVIGGEETTYTYERVGDRDRKFIEGDMAVCTPGRLIDVVNRGSLRLRNCDTVILDEFDDLLDSRDFIDIVRTVNLHCPDRRVLGLFSATFPQKVINEAQKLGGNRCLHVDVGSDSTEIVRQRKHVFHLHEDQEFIYQTELPKLIQEIRDTDPRKEDCKIMAFVNIRTNLTYLRERGYLSGINNVEFIQGEQDWAERRRIVGKFKQSGGVLVCTDLLHRGIHIPTMDYVINIDFPNSDDKYVHRAGRSGRLGEENAGEVHSFMLPSDVANIGFDICKLMIRCGQREAIPAILRGEDDGNMANIDEEIEREKQEEEELYKAIIPEYDFQKDEGLDVFRQPAYIDENGNDGWAGGQGGNTDALGQGGNTDTWGQDQGGNTDTWGQDQGGNTDAWGQDQDQGGNTGSHHGFDAGNKNADTWGAPAEGDNGWADSTYDAETW